MTVIELVSLASLITNYDFKSHVASDVGIDEFFIPADHLQSQQHLDNIAEWTQDRKMKINENKTKYMVFSRSNTEFATRLKMNNKVIDRIEETKLVGVWVTTFLDWEKNTREICKKAYSRIPMLTKLKYVGVRTEDLIHLYILFIRCILEYCAVVWHSTLTVQQSKDIEKVQKLVLKIILGDRYINYENALRLTGLESLSDRREQKCLQFGLKSLLHPIHCKNFPVNPEKIYNTRNSEHFKVNRAHSEYYRKFTIPYVQRLLNQYVRNMDK